MIVFTRRLPINHVFARADDGVATSRATGANALGFFQEPDAHFETEIGRGERGYRADIDRVKRVIVFQPFAGVRGQHGVTASIDEPDDVVVRDLLTETNATRAENAAFVIERDSRPEHNIFRFLHFVLQKARLRSAEIDAELLQSTFAGLVANRTIERMIDEEKFHHPALAFLYQW